MLGGITYIDKNKINIVVRLPDNDYASLFTAEEGMNVVLRMFLYTHKCINGTISFTLEELFRETGIKDQKRNKAKIAKALMEFQAEGVLSFTEDLESARLTKHISAKLYRDDLFYERCETIFTTLSLEEYEKIAKTSNPILITTILMAIKLRYFTVKCSYPISMASLGINDIASITNISKPTLMKCLDEMMEQKVIYRVHGLQGEKYNGDIIKLSTLYSSTFIGFSLRNEIYGKLAEKWKLKKIKED